MEGVDVLLRALGMVLCGLDGLFVDIDIEGGDITGHLFGIMQKESIRDFAV